MTDQPARPSAADVLLVLNDLEPIDLSTLTFHVITGAGTVAVIRGELVDTGQPRYWPFGKGEILIIGESDREPFGQGRKPSKWSVTVAEFAVLADAQECRLQVLAGTWDQQAYEQRKWGNG